MPSLILFRHAKSEWDLPYKSDKDRPLTPRGISSAQKMGRWLADTGNTPQRVLCSNALRTKETLRLAMLAGAWSSDTVEYLSELYEVEALEAFEVLKSHGQKAESLMLVGHEPCLSGLLSLCVGCGNFHFPTAAVAVLETAGNEWSEMDLGSFQLRVLITPKSLVG